MEEPIGERGREAGPAAAEEPGREGPAASPAQAPAPEPSIRSLRTFRGDVEEVVRDQRASIVSIAAKESERRGAAGLPFDAAPRRSYRAIAIVAASVLLFALGAAALGFLFLRGSGTVGEQRGLAVPHFFFTERQDPVEMTGLAEKTLLERLANARRQTELPLGSIRQLYPTVTASTTAIVPAREFLQALGSHVPPELARVALPDFMIGIHVFDGNQPFILLHVDPYEQAFAAMLAWEPFLLADLSPFFAAPQDGGVLTFADAVIENKDARRAQDATGKTVALYSFLDRSTLLITTNEQTLMEVVSRLTTPRI